MARRQSTGEIRVWWVTDPLFDPAAPSVALLTGANAVDLTPYMRRDGLNTPQAGTTADAADASSRFNKTAPGTFGGDAATYQGYRDSDPTQDVAWDSLPRDEAGALVVRRFGGSKTAPAAGDVVEIYEGTVISREPAPTGDNEMQRFTATISLEEDPVMDGVLVA